jgi:hypothetical protein
MGRPEPLPGAPVAGIISSKYSRKPCRAGKDPFVLWHESATGESHDRRIGVTASAVHEE